MAEDDEKRWAAEHAALLPDDGMTVGLGTGTTVAVLLPALARRRLAIVCVATSPATEEAAVALGLEVRPFESLDHLDLAIDGADQVDTDCWLVKGAGGAHTREKIVAAAADRFVVIVSESKLVEELAPPVPLELLGFGLEATLARLGEVRLRPGPPSPDGGLLADYLGEVASPAELAAELSATPGVVDHGLFSAELVSEVLVGRPDGSVTRILP